MRRGHATYVACGLKYAGSLGVAVQQSHATYVACGLKCRNDGRRGQGLPSCHVCGMWIEIKQPHPASLQAWSCHVCGMWIEMYLPGASSQVSRSHATYVACGLKWLVNILITSFRCHATYVACGLKLTGGAVYGFCARHATYVACGLKL